MLIVRGTNYGNLDEFCYDILIGDMWKPLAMEELLNRESNGEVIYWNPRRTEDKE